MTTSRAVSVLRNPDFVRLWTAETISQFGTQISLLALPLVAVTLLNASAFEVAALGTIELLPFILFSLPAGAWVDRLRHRPIRRWTGASRAPERRSAGAPERRSQ